MKYNLNDYPTISEELLSFRKIFPSIKLDTVYYPCSGHDRSVFLTLEKSRVVNVDMNENAIETLISIGAEAYISDVKEFNFTEKIGEQADLLYILNPQIKLNEIFISKCLKIGGYCLSNNYHETAEDLKEINCMAPLGVIYDGEFEKDLNNVWETIKKYRLDNPVSMFSPFMDSRFVFQRIS